MIKPKIPAEIIILLHFVTYLNQHKVPAGIWLHFGKKKNLIPDTLINSAHDDYNHHDGRGINTFNFWNNPIL